jgi:hypothetical protein
MKNFNKTMLIVIIVGALSILFSTINIFMGETLSSQLWGLFLGVVLIGTGWIENQKNNSETKRRTSITHTVHSLFCVRT